VVDHTGLTGNFDMSHVDWAQFGPALRRGSMDAPSDAAFHSVEDQLGLKLEARKEATELLVIDHAEKPTANK